MNLADIIALAKQGYKPGDIRDLIELAKPEPFNPPTDPEQQASEPDDKQEPEKKTEPKPEAKPDSDDLTKTLQELKAELDKTKEDLKKAQQENARKGVEQTDAVDVDKNINDWIRSFM